jgi:hypothetical protein
MRLLNLAPHCQIPPMTGADHRETLNFAKDLSWPALGAKLARIARSAPLVWL